MTRDRRLAGGALIAGPAASWLSAFLALWFLDVELEAFVRRRVAERVAAGVRMEDDPEAALRVVDRVWVAGSIRRAVCRRAR